MEVGSIANIGTLGSHQNDVTCSMLAARSIAKTRNIMLHPYDRYEPAVDSVISGLLDAALVPAAYPGINKFIMDDRTEISDVILYRIPPLVFVSKYITAEARYHKLFNHPATNPLVDHITCSTWDAQENVTSNSVACERALDVSGVYCAITNKVCAEKYHLHIHEVIRKPINMPFILFTKAK